MSMTMPVIDEEEKKTNASKTSIECIERQGKYNPLRAHPVKVRIWKQIRCGPCPKAEEKITQRNLCRQRVQ